MKKALIFILLTCLVASLAACGGGESENSSKAEPVSSESPAESSAVSEPISESESSVADESSEIVGEESENVSEPEASEPEASEPEEFDVGTLIGSWKRIGVEVEGDVNDGGNCTITITGTSKDDLKISYDDKDFTDNSFSDKTVTIVDSGSDTDLSEGEWYAVIDHVGPFETTYDFEIAEDGTLVFYNNFEIDGAPAISVEIFEKAE